MNIREAETPDLDQLSKLLIHIECSMEKNQILYF